MSIGAFTDKQHQPTMDAVLDSIGAGRPAWESLDQYISENFRVQRDLRFYGKNYGWAVRVRKGGKALLSLYPRQDGFTVQIVLDESAVQSALRLKLGKNTRRAIEAAHPYPEGRWLFIAVESAKDVTDIKHLLDLKARPSKQ